MSARELSAAERFRPETIEHLRALLREAADVAASGRGWAEVTERLPNGMPRTLKTGKRDQSQLPPALRIRSEGRH